VNKAKLFYVGDCVMSRGAWTYISTGSERTSVTCLLPF